MEASSPGFVAFNPTKPATAIPLHVDVAQLVAMFKAIKDPGPTPNINAAIIVPTGTVAAAPTGTLLSTLKTRAYLGIGASATGAFLICFGGFAILPGLAALGAGLVANIAIPKELKRLREARSLADVAWRDVQNAWTKQPGNGKFLEVKMQVDAQI